MALCPCGSNNDYNNCCKKVHDNHAMAVKPEQLMRARYSAHVLKNVDFIVDTYHSSCNAQNDRQGITDSVQLNWQRLEVMATPEPSDNNGIVEFKAYYIEGLSEQYMHERSRFIKEKGYWYYLDGHFPAQKVGRNDPCLCGSGKKYKKCCA